MNVRTAIVFSASLAAMLIFGFCGAASGRSVTVTVDENGYGTMLWSDGQFSKLGSYFGPDPSTGGLEDALIYDTSFSTVFGVGGDVILTDANCGGCVSDVIRFVDFEQAFILIYYSAKADGAPSLADTGFPSSIFSNHLSIPEVSTGFGSRTVYTPLPGQPGYLAANPIVIPVTYTFISGTPEPSSLVLLGTGLFGIARTLRSRFGA